MKTRNFLYLAIVLVGMLATSCTVTHPYAVTNNPIGKKKGKSTTKVILGLGGVSAANPQSGISSVGIRFNKSYGIAEAAKRGKITRIAAVDLEYTNYILFGKYTLIVIGD